MTLDELLLEWSYRSERGYPTLDNPSDVSVLKEILTKLNLSEQEIDDVLDNLPDEPGGDDLTTPGTDGMEDSSVEKEKERISNPGDAEYDAVIRNHLGLNDDQPIPQPKNKYPFDPSGGTFSIQVKGDDLKYWSDFWTLTPPKKGAEIGTTSKGSGDGEISLYWLYQHSNTIDVKGTQGSDNPDLRFGGLGVEVKAFTKHGGKHGLGRFGQDREQLKLLGVIFGINTLTTLFKGIPDGKSRAPKDVNPLTWDGNNLKDAMEEVLKFKNVDIDQLADIPGYDVFKDIKQNLDFLDKKLGDYSTAEEGARAMALEFIKPKVARKPGDGGFLVNVLRTGNCRFWKIEYDKVVSNENALKYIGAAQAQMKVNFEELFGN